jgi:hypothetical protein
MMVRTQIQLTDEQANKVRAIAAAEKQSMAEIIRLALDRQIGRPAELSGRVRRERACAIAGRFASGRADISERHDELLAEPEAE